MPRSLILTLLATLLGLAANAVERHGFLEKHCFECHDSDLQKGDLNLEALAFDLTQPETFDQWRHVHDRIKQDEMPPKKVKARPSTTELDAFLPLIAGPLKEADRKRIATKGRASVRRLNRHEFGNALREVLDAPWLQLADHLPEDSTAHLFNKSGERLDVSHVQIAKFFEVAELGLRAALRAAAHPSKTTRFYARDEDKMKGYLHYRRLQSSATRAAIPLIGTTTQPEVIRGNEPFSVGSSNPEIRTQEAVGFVSGTYSATTKYDFTRMRKHVPTDGRYKVRMKTYTFLAGLNGRSGGDDEGLTGGRQAWWRPNRNEAFPGNRSEPVTLYALAESGDNRWLTTFDSFPEAKVIEREIHLQSGEGIRPDATRLVRTRPGFKGNPNASEAGIPGVAFQWLELEGPLRETWPPQSYQALFGDTPFAVSDRSEVTVQADEPRPLLVRFLNRVLRRPGNAENKVAPYLKIYNEARKFDHDFTDAMITAYAAMLCSSDFLYLESTPGELSTTALAERLATFLWNGVPDSSLREASDPRSQTERLLNDPKSDRFINTFLDYWLDLREINTNSPDATLYPDYYLDDLLTESSILETRRFFRELIDEDLPVRNLIHSDFIFANERLSQHYNLPPTEGVALKRLPVPADSPRGGLLTHASVLTVTANGTTTTPVLRGAWIMERLLGVEIPPPPSGVGAIEPDIRGAETIREQLDLHRSHASCKSCHEKFDPAGFALESFDVAGGWRERYRSVGDDGEPAEGIGKNGHLFTFRHGPKVDPSGQLEDGRAFKDIRGLKALLLEDERQIARNLLHRLITFATGAPVSFSDRNEVEAILNRTEAESHGVRSLIHALVDSRLFQIK